MDKRSRDTSVIAQPLVGALLKAVLDKELRWTELRLYEGVWRSGDW